MKAKEFMDLLASVRNKFRVTFVDNEMLDIIQYLCEYTGTEAIFDKDGKWSIPLDKDNEAGDDNGKS